MQALKEIEKEVQDLSSSEYSNFRTWFYQYDNDVWDTNVKNDSDAGKLDFLIDEYKAEKKSGNLKSL